MDRLKQRGADLVYRCGKGHTEPLQSDKYSGEQVLTPLELINRIAQLVPPPRTHRHRYHGVLAPNSPLRAAVTALAQGAQVVASIVRSPVVVQPGTVDSPEPQAKPMPRPPSQLPVGRTDRPYLRGVSADLPDVQATAVGWLNRRPISRTISALLREFAIGRQSIAMTAPG